MKKTSLPVFRLRCARSLLLLPLVALPFNLLGAEEENPVVWNNADIDLPPGIVHQSFESGAMGRTIGYTVSTPPGYAESSASYPVVYFLHGYGGNETSDGQGFSSIAHALALKHQLPPVICVFPNGGRSGYRDQPEAGEMVKTMILDELIPLIDETYRTLPTRESRAVAGFSMGANGSLFFAFSRPDLFSVCAGWAGSATYPYGSEELPEMLTPEALAALEQKVDLLLVVGHEDTRALKGLKFFREALDEAKYSYTFRTLADVPHNLGLYYQRSGEDFVRFIVSQLQTEEEAVTE
jgi:endo-1,4-beta-xylanase